MQIIPYTTDVPNAYQNLPEYACEIKPIEQFDFLTFINALNIPSAIKRATAAIIFWETGRVSKIINNNCPNCQADVGPWNKKYNSWIIGTTVKVDSTGSKRRFCVFDTWQNSVKMLANYVYERQIYIGAIGVENGYDLYDRYNKKWILGDDKAVTNPKEAYGFSDLYNNVVTLLQSPKPIIIYKYVPGNQMKGPAVEAIQTKLVALGYLEKKDILGIFGPHTEYAVTQFQKDKRLAPNGIVDTPTMKALGL